MKAKDLILYQIATDRNYKVGDVLTFDKNTPNGQYRRVFNNNFKLNGERPCDEMYQVAKGKFKKFKSKDDIFSIAHILENYDVLTKEIALEEIRKQYFPEYPSRLHCMYLSISKDISLKNIQTMSSSPEKHGKIFQAVAVKLNGEIFKAGKVYMSREAESYSYYLDKAKLYWKQSNLMDEEVKEVLFEGQAEVVEILKEIRI